MNADLFPPFQPHPLLRSGHAQTIVGNFFPGKKGPYRAVRHAIELADGDTIVLHDDCPYDWKPADRVLLLVHGLAGCHESGYMIRIARKLNQIGVRSIRMDLRSCGAGQGLARLPYHAGRSEDVMAALEHVGSLCPGSPLNLVGFSLGGNIVLKLLGETPHQLPAQLVSAMVVNPALDLAACIDWIERSTARLYDRHFVKQMCQQVEQSRKIFPEGRHYRFERIPRCIREFDDLYTAPLCGFGTAAAYYEQCSAAQFVADIRIPTLILASRDDPVIPVSTFEKIGLPSAVTLHLCDHGGHLGYIGRSGVDPDRRWMDWRVIDWATKISPHASASQSPMAAQIER